MTEYTSKHLLSDEAILALGVKEHSVEVYRRLHYTNQFGLSSWYESLKEHTMKSKFLPLSFQEARAMLDKHLKRDLTEEQQELLKILEGRIQAGIDEMGTSIFIKLSTRSPKDVYLYDFDNKDVQSLILEELKERNAQTDSERCISFVVATQRVMQVGTGQEALALMLKSQRVYQDLSKQMQFPTELFQSSIVLREWCPNVPRQPGGEFRAWVHNNQLCACTQYYSFIHFPHVVERKEEISQKIQQFFVDHVQAALDHRVSYGIDFFFDFITGRILVIELNTFGTQAGTGLFSWKDDREQMLNGPFELRVLETTPDDPLELVPKRWRRWMEENQSSCTIF